MSDNKTVDEVMELLNITSRQALYHRINIIDLGEPVYQMDGTRKKRVFTKEQVDTILNTPISKGGRGCKRIKI